MSEKKEKRRRKVQLIPHIVCVRGEGKETEKRVVLNPKNLPVDIQKDGDKIVLDDKWDKVFVFNAFGDGTELL